jgi:hypothetical protein
MTDRERLAAILARLEATEGDWEFSGAVGQFASIKAGKAVYGFLHEGPPDSGTNVDGQLIADWRLMGHSRADIRFLAELAGLFLDMVEGPEGNVLNAMWEKGRREGWAVASSGMTELFKAKAVKTLRDRAAREAEVSQMTSLESNQEACELFSAAYNNAADYVEALPLTPPPYAEEAP